MTTGHLEAAGRILVAACLLVVPKELSAQSASISGTVIDGVTERPVGGALVRIPVLDRNTLSGEGGAFAFNGLPDGTAIRLTVTHLSYQEEAAVVETGTAGATGVVVRLFPRPIQLDSIGVTIEQRIPYLDRIGFYERRERGWGTFLDPDWVTTRNRGFPSADRFVDYVKGQAPSMSCPRTPVYLDGRRIINEPGRGRSENDMLRELSSHDFGAVEVYPTGHGVPPFALNDTTLVCGAVVMWTKQWTDPEDIPGIDVVLCTPEGTAGATTIEGYVRDELTGVVLPAARVSLDPGDGSAVAPEAVADRFGRYRFCDVGRGEDLAAIARYGDETGDRASPAAIARADTVELDLVVPVTRPGQVAGRVTDGSTGGGIAGARVSLEGTDVSATTDSRGYFRLRDVIPGDYALTVGATRFPAVSRDVTVRSGQVADVSVTLGGG